jgi:hypothetical protein
MLMNRISLISGMVAVAALAAACSTGISVTPAVPAPVTSLPSSPTSTPAEGSQRSQSKAGPTVSPGATNVRVEDPREYSFSPLLPFDAIRPVYDPQFASVSDAPLVDDELVIGIALNGEAKAYPITVLRSREIVNDELGGIPILVTW